MKNSPAKAASPARLPPDASTAANHTRPPTVSAAGPASRSAKNAIFPTFKQALPFPQLPEAFFFPLTFYYKSLPMKTACFFLFAAFLSKFHPTFVVERAGI